MRLYHTMIRVKDLEATLAFYTGFLRLEEVRRHELGDEATLVFLSDADRNYYLELTFNKDGREALRHGVERAWNFLQRIRRPELPGLGARSADLLLGLRDEMRSATVDSVRAAGGSHRALTHYIDCLAEFGIALHDEYFDPKDFELRAGEQNQ